MLFEGDSFFTLGEYERIGLAVLSAVLAVVSVLGVVLIARGEPIWMRIMLALMCVWGFEWFSPQFYYFYYMFIFDQLPMQWVIGWPGLVEPLKIMLFQAEDSLSAQSRGVLAWMMIAAGALAGRR